MKQLIFIRHAHRDTDNRESDNGLSEKGQKQALLLAQYWEKKLKGMPCTLLSSPKKRCQETLAPLASALGVKVKTCKELDEATASEGEVKFNRRVRDFLKDWQESPLTLACSHGDWIPQAIAIATGEIVSLKKGAFAVIELGEKKPKLVSVVQSLAGPEYQLEYQEE